MIPVPRNPCSYKGAENSYTCEAAEIFPTCLLVRIGGKNFLCVSCYYSSPAAVSGHEIEITVLLYFDRETKYGQNITY